MCEREVGGLAFGQLRQEVMIVLRDLTILASNQALELPKSFEPLFDGAFLVFGGTTILSVNVSGFVKVDLGESFCSNINSLPVGLVPSRPRA